MEFRHPAACMTLVIRDGRRRRCDVRCKTWLQCRHRLLPCLLACLLAHSPSLTPAVSRITRRSTPGCRATVEMAGVRAVKLATF